jgi:hypothetical protein
MEFDYTITTQKDFAGAVEGVQQEVAKAGMRVLYVHDVQATLIEKGFQREPFKIIEFCNAKYANVFYGLMLKSACVCPARSMYMCKTVKRLSPACGQLFCPNSSPMLI